MVGPGRWLLARSQCLEHASRAGREASREERRGREWKWRVIGLAGLRSPEPASLSALLQRRSGRRLRRPKRANQEPPGAGRCRRRLVESLVTKRDKGRRGKEKKRRKKKKKERKRKRRLLTQAGRALGGSSCPETGRAPAEARSARTSRRGRTGWHPAALPGDWPRGSGPREGVLSLGGTRGLLALRMSPGRVLPPRTSSPC